MNRVRIYYAHCLALYGTPQEARDIRTLEALGFAVINPNTVLTDSTIRELKGRGCADYMDYFKGMIRACDALAFRALPDARIPSGVAKEIEYAQAFKLPVIELPSCVLTRTMALDETREYLAEVGQR